MCLGSDEEIAKMREIAALQLLYTTESVEDVRSRSPSPLSSDSSVRSVVIQ